MTLWPPIVTLHLLAGNLLFGLLVFLTRIVYENKNDHFRNFSKYSESLKNNGSHTILKKIKIMIVVFFIILLSGGYNSSTYSGAHCEAFPGCHEGSTLSISLSGVDVSFISNLNEHILPHAPLEFQGRFLPEYKNEWINMIHRFVAIIGGSILIAMAWFWINKKYGNFISTSS